MATHELFAYLRVKGAAEAIEFYSKVFGAKETFRLAEPGGRIGHAQLDFDGTTLMVSEEYPELGILGPQSVGGASVTIHLHVDNADEVIKAAIDAGAEVTSELKDQFYGERSGNIRDPFGHEWNIGHSIEKISTDEMQRRFSAMFKK
jgi:PhnB protein